MRASQEEKSRSRSRIIREAARMARERGVDGTSVADAMSAAGMTHGGFYKHFASKDALLAAALQAAFDDVIARFGGASALEAASVDGAFGDIYLSDEHVQNAGLGCPVPALAADTARGSAELKTVFGAGVRRMAEMLASCDADQGPGNDASGLSRLAMMAGAVMIARASDPATGAAVIDACRRSLADINKGAHAR